MTAFNELDSSPGGAMHDIAPVDAADIYAAGECADQTTAQDGANPGSADAADISVLDDLILASPRARSHTSTARILRAALKPLIAVITAQYAIVTALTVFAALVVASEAGKAINAKLEPIIAALKRL